MEQYWKRFSLLAFLSLLLSGYLLFHYTEVTGGFQEEKSFCSISATLDCDTVAQSGYAVFLGVPVAGWAFVYYVVFLVLVQLFASRKRLTEVKNGESIAADLLFFYSFISLIPSVLLLGVSHFILGKYCLMCCALDIANVLLFGLAFYAPAREHPFFKSLTAGAATFFRAMFDFGSRGGFSPALSLWFSLLISVCLVLVVPEALSRHYFMPRRQSYTDKDYLQPFIETWKREPGKGIPFNASAPPIEKDFALGNPEAKVQIVEFSDFECPYCKKMAQFIKPFILANPNDFYFVFKNYPLDKNCNTRIKEPKHLYACEAAIMARCAGLQSDQLFWRVHDAIMAASTVDHEVLKTIADEAKVHEGAFDTCLNDVVVASRVKQDADLGNSLGVISTPTVYVNGKKVQIAAPYMAGFLKLLSEELKRSH